MSRDPHDSTPVRGGEALLRAVSRATSAASLVLDPHIVPESTVDAAVRYLSAHRADVWRFDGRRPVHVASAGSGHIVPATLPAIALKIARGGIGELFHESDLGNGAGTDWRKLLFSLDTDTVGVYSLMTGESCYGCLTIIPSHELSGLEHEANMIFAQQAAAAIEKANLHGTVQEAAISIRMQNRVLRELTDERDVPSLQDALEMFLDDVVDDVTVTVLPIDSSDRITIPCQDNGSSILRVAGDPEISALQPVLRSRRASQLHSMNKSIATNLQLDPSAVSGYTTGVRLSIGDRNNGVLLASIPTDDDRAVNRLNEMLDVIAPAASIALDNAQLFSREHQRASKLVTANSLARTVTGCQTTDELVEALNTGVHALFNFHRVSIFDRNLAKLHDGGAADTTRSYNRERSLVSTALHRRRSSRIERHDVTCHAIPIASGEHIHAVLYVEQFDFVTPEQEADDLALLRAISEHAAACLVAIDATTNIERNYKDTIQALVHALEARDQYTADHSDVVASWALEIGRRLGMSESDLRDLELAAILHDIGKVAIPDSILNKPGRLTEDEFEVMKSHTVVGERILQPIGFLKNVAPIVRHEHERWDGRGYPDGISGTDIPLSSRIIFVCDAYHAITSDRPYREGQTHAFARKIISENAGTQFDPAIVSVFTDVLDQWLISEGMSHELENGFDSSGIEIVNGLTDSASDADDAQAA